MKKSFLTVLSVFVLLVSLFGTAYASETETIAISAVYGQTEARTQLEMINDLRKNEAWYNDIDGTVKKLGTLEPLSYDYALEEYAMQRAAEIAINFAHTRPDGTDPLDDFPEGYRAYGENIAFGFASAEKAFEAWCETDRPFYDQGHRRNMLSEDFTCVAVGYAAYEGMEFWVQEFGAPINSGKYTAPFNGARTVEIDLCESVFRSIESNVLQDKIYIQKGTSAELPDIEYFLSDFYEEQPRIIYSGTRYSCDNDQVIEIRDGKIIGKKEGTAVLTCTGLGKTDKIPVSVYSSEKYQYSGRCGENITWKLNTDSGILKIEGTGAMFNVGVTRDDDCYYDDHLADKAEPTFHDYSDNIYSVEISEGITVIGDCAFNSLENIASVTIPDSVTQIGEYAFAGCSKLAEVTFGSGIRTIKTRAFSGCDRLTKLNNYHYDPESFSDIFYSCPSLGYKADNIRYYDNILIKAESNSIVNVTVPEGIEYISASAFFLCEELKTVTFPSSLKKIFSHAFDGCRSLSTVTFNSAVNIGSSAFYSCKALKNIVLPDGCGVEDFAFEYSGLENVICKGRLDCIEARDFLGETPYAKNKKNYEDGCLYLGDALLSYDLSAANVTVREGTRVICKYAFLVDPLSEEDALESIVFPDSLEMIGEDAFFGCKKLTEVKFGKSLKKISAGAFYESGIREAILPEGLEIIGDQAFAMSNVNSAVIPSTVEYFGDEAFEYCYYLQRVQLPDGLTCIPPSAFACCVSLENITLPENLVEISELAFYSTPIKEVNIPRYVEYIGKSAFAGTTMSDYSSGSYYYYKGVKSFSVDPQNKYFSADEHGVLFNKDKTELLYYPAGSESKSYTVPKNTLVIGENAFFSAHSLEDITLNGKLLKIKNEAFSDMKIREIFIPASVEEIHQSSFYMVDTLEKITVDPANKHFFADENGVLYSADKKIVYCVPQKLRSSILKPAPEVSSFFDVNTDNIVYADFSALKNPGKPMALYPETDPRTGEKSYDLLHALSFDLYGLGQMEAISLSDAVLGHYDYYLDYEYLREREHKVYYYLNKSKLKQITLNGEFNDKQVYVYESLLYDNAITVYGRFDKELEDAFNESDINYRRLCDKCSLKETERHQYCNKKGYIKYECTVCGHWEYKELPQLPHEMTTFTTPASLETDGQVKYFCKNCDYYYYEKIPDHPGDVNGDGSITAADARLALRVSVGLEKYDTGSIQFYACDANFDYKITSADARLILRAAVGLEKPEKWKKK